MTAGLFDDDETGGSGSGLMGGGIDLAVRNAQVLVKAPAGTTLESIPSPYSSPGEGELTPQEQQDLEACKAGMNNLQTAFWVAGKSLETMRSGNLQRQEHPNFAEYVWNNWEVSESQMHRLMEAWRIGEALVGLGWKPREAQVRELTGMAKESGERVAVAVYDSVARNVKRVTAQVIKQVVDQLPPLPSDASPADISQMVRTALAPPRESTENTATSHVGGVPDITSLREDGAETVDSPIGESTGRIEVDGANDRMNGEARAEASEAEGEEVEPANPLKSEDVQRLIDAANLIQKAERLLNQAVVRRALAQHPDYTVALIGKMEASGNKIGRAIAVRKPAK